MGSPKMPVTQTQFNCTSMISCCAWQQIMIKKGKTGQAINKERLPVTRTQRVHYKLVQLSTAASNIASVSAREHEDTVAQHEMNFSMPSDTIRREAVWSQGTDSASPACQTKPSVSRHDCPWDWHAKHWTNSCCYPSSAHSSPRCRQGSSTTKHCPPVPPSQHRFRCPWKQNARPRDAQPVRYETHPSATMSSFGLSSLASPSGSPFQWHPPSPSLQNVPLKHQSWTWRWGKGRATSSHWHEPLPLATPSPCSWHQQRNRTKKANSALQQLASIGCIWAGKTPGPAFEHCPQKIPGSLHRVPVPFDPRDERSTSTRFPYLFRATASFHGTPDAKPPWPCGCCSS